MTIKQRYSNIIEWFSKNMPEAETELIYHDDFSLLVAVILSAQCTDKRVNMVTPTLLKKYPTPFEMALASQEKIFELIRSISYPNSKSRYLLNLSQNLVERFDGKVPNTLDDLQSLAGVGRKTANVVLSVLHNQPTMAVDTHVYRVSNRIGLTNNSKNVLETEKTLIKYIPKNLIPKAHHWLILHGRYVCIARKPLCENCGISTFCKYFTKSN